MGACSSCLGERNRDLSDADDSSRLLFEDSHANNYGSFGDQNGGAMPADPEEVQRENEALHKVVIQTSNHLVDIFAVATQDPAPPPNAIFSGQDTRLLRYRDVLAKLSTAAPSKSRDSSLEMPPVGSDGWISGDDDDDNDKASKQAPDDIGPLIGGFADSRLSAH